MTVSTPRSDSRARDVRSRNSDSGVVIRMSGGCRRKRRRSSAGVSPERIADVDVGLGQAEAGRGVPDAGQRCPQVALDVDGERLHRGDVEDPAAPLGVGRGGLGGEPVERPEERGQGLAGAGRGDDQGVAARADGLPGAGLGGRGVGEGALEPRLGGGGEAAERSHPSILPLPPTGHRTIADGQLGGVAADTGLMRLTEFWRRMGEAFDGHAQSIAELHVFSELGNRTPLQALEAGESAKDVWRGVCEGMEIPTACAEGILMPASSGLRGTARADDEQRQPWIIDTLVDAFADLHGGRRGLRFRSKFRTRWQPIRSPSTAVVRALFYARHGQDWMTAGSTERTSRVVDPGRSACRELRHRTWTAEGVLQPSCDVERLRRGLPRCLHRGTSVRFVASVGRAPRLRRQARLPEDVDQRRARRWP